MSKFKVGDIVYINSQRVEAMMYENRGIGKGAKGEVIESDALIYKVAFEVWSSQPKIVWLLEGVMSHVVSDMISESDEAFEERMSYFQHTTLDPYHNLEHFETSGDKVAEGNKLTLDVKYELITDQKNWVDEDVLELAYIIEDDEVLLDDEFYGDVYIDPMMLEDYIQNSKDVVCGFIKNL